MKQRWPKLLTALLAVAFLSACHATAPTSIVQAVTPIPVRPTDVPRVLTVIPLPQAPKPEAPTPIPTVPTPSPMSPQPSIDWPMFRFSLDRAGYNPTETSVRPPLELKWRFEARSKI